VPINQNEKRFVMNSSDIVNAILASRLASTAAFDRVLPEMHALDASEVRPLNLDIPTVVSRVLGAGPKVLAMRADIVRDAPSVDIHKVDCLQDYANALQEAHVRCLGSGKCPDELRALGEEGDALRGLLRSDVSALVRRGLIDPARLSACKGLPGYKNIATELGVLASVMLSRWPQIQGKCCVTEQDLARAQGIAQALLAYVGIRDELPEVKAAATDLRDRAFTLLADSYDEARRAVTHLRWKAGDTDVIAPSLYSGKHRTSKRADDQPQQPSASATTQPAPVAPPTPENGSPRLQEPVYVAPGRPNSNPFMQ
jgi:hypothetical protein